MINLWYPTPQQLSPDYWKGTKAELAAQAEAVGLPTLVGSPRQISWAETLRVEFIVAVSKIARECEDAEQASLLLGGMSVVLARQVDAAWWIETRFDDLRHDSRRWDAIQKSIPIWEEYYGI